MTLKTDTEFHPLASWQTGYSEANKVIVMQMAELEGAAVSVYMEAAMAEQIGKELLRLAALGKPRLII